MYMKTQWLRMLPAATIIGTSLLFGAGVVTDTPALSLAAGATLLLGLGITLGVMAAGAGLFQPAWRTSGPSAEAGDGEVAARSAGPWDVAASMGVVERPRVKFDEVAGLDEVLGELRELVGYVKERSRYLALDARLPRGVLLYGPPGTGKTLLAKALAGEADAAFFYASGSSFVEKYVGVGAQRVRELFARARRQAPAVVFIDEIDSIGRARGNGDSNEWDTALNQLLTELDGFEKTENIILVAATNRRELLDEALLRPGRLDRQVYLGLPDLPARAAILGVHTRKKPLGPDVDLAALARRTPGLSGAHLAAVANEAALAAARAQRSQLTMTDFEAALDRTLLGQSGQPNVLSPAERWLVAVHEAGHALVGWALAQGAIERITLLSRSQALGYVLQVPEQRLLQTRGDLLRRIAVLLAGRAAEQMVAGDVSSGASDDLQKATAIAEKMVTELGMGRRHPNQVLRPQSVMVSRAVSTEVGRIIGEGWETAQELTLRHRDALLHLAKLLIERESLTRAEIEAVLAPQVPAA